MKAFGLKILLIAQLLLFPLYLTSVLADPPGPPSPGANPAGHGGHPVGYNTGAPIEDGIGVLLLLGLSYGTFKVYKSWKKKQELKGDDRTVQTLSETK
jgi:hypothetical protein